MLLYDALAGDSTAEKKILIERAQGIERAVWEVFNGSTGNDYRQSGLVSFEASFEASFFNVTRQSPSDIFLIIVTLRS